MPTIPRGLKRKYTKYLNLFNYLKVQKSKAIGSQSHTWAKVRSRGYTTTPESYVLAEDVTWDLKLTQ